MSKLIKRFYTRELPPRINRLIKWLLDVGHFPDHDRFSDIDGSTEYLTVQLSYRKVMLVIDKTSCGDITFQLEVERE